MATTFYNTATLSYNGVTTTSNTVTGEIADNLTVAKTALTDGYTAGAEKTFVINLVNTGQTALNGLTVTDDLGTYTLETGNATPLTYAEGTAQYFVGGVLQTEPTATAGPPLIFTGINVPAGENAAIVYQATVNEFAPLDVGGSITNTVTVTGDGLTAPATASATITVENEPMLSIGKAVNPTSVTSDGTLTYTFTINNTGNTAADATDNVTVTDAFTPELSALTVTLDGVPLSAGTGYTYSGGTFRTVPGVITVPAATYAQTAATGAWTVTPGAAILTVAGTV
ncbi:MAG: hypothetical protein IJL83_02380 [Clostridia bacterium]|nr:hypothetical protein [Clostridia bacterium]